MTHHETRSSDELEPAPTAARKSAWGWVAMTAVGVVVAGLVGYAAGTGTADGQAPAAAPISLATGVPSAGDAAGEAQPGVPWYGFGRVRFDSRGLSDDPGRASAYAYDPSQVFSRQTAAAAAGVLGVGGSPTLADGVWVAGPSDGSGRTVQLMPDGWATVSFYDPSLEPYGCAVAESDPGSSGEPTRDDPAADCKSPQQDPEGDAAAVERTRTLLADLGIDVDDIELEAGPSWGRGATAVTAFDVVAGQRTGATWSVVWVGRAVQSLYGPLAPLVPLGAYDVVGAQTGVARLNDPRFGAYASGGPYPLAFAAEAGQPQADAGSDPSGDAVATDAAMGSVTLPPPVQPGSRFAWPVQEVTVTEARLGLALYWQPDGSQVLLPTYELTDADGGVWAVVAVSDDGLDFQST